jgi:hypothetical protein
MDRNKWSLILLFLVFFPGCVPLVLLAVSENAEKHGRESADRTTREIEQKMGYNQPVPANVWSYANSLVLVSYGPWQSYSDSMAVERTIGKGVALGVISGGLLLADPSNFFKDVGPEFQEAAAKILSREKLQEVQARFNNRLLQNLKPKFGFPIKVINLDMTGNMIAQSRDLYKEWHAGTREVVVMPNLIFSGSSPMMQVEAEWRVIKEPAAFEKGLERPGWSSRFRPDAVGKVRYKSASHAPSQWLENSGSLLKQELDKAADQLAFEVAQALLNSPTSP